MSLRPSTARAVRGFALPTVAIALAVALSGCTPDSGAKDQSEAGPLAEYLSALYDGEEYTQERLDAETAKTEELVAACMTAEGFEYQPNVQNGSTFISSDQEPDGPEWGSVEFAEQYGYGFTDSPGMAEQPDDAEVYVDPNEEYVNSLSESEQQAYSETLYGPPQTEESLSEDGSYEYDWKTAGCQGAAQHEVMQDANGAMAAQEDPAFTDLFTSMNEMYGKLYDTENPTTEMRELFDRWASCMSDAGFGEFTSPDDAQNTVAMENSELYSAGTDGEEWVEPNSDQLQEFKKREIEVAVADATCKKQTSYNDEFQKITFAVEQEFLDAHRSELDALLAKYGSGKQ